MPTPMIRIMVKHRDFRGMLRFVLSVPSSAGMKLSQSIKSSTITWSSNSRNDGRTTFKCSCRSFTNPPLLVFFPGSLCPLLHLGSIFCFFVLNCLRVSQVPWIFFRFRSQYVFVIVASRHCYPYPPSTHRITLM